MKNTRLIVAGLVLAVFTAMGYSAARLTATAEAQDCCSPAQACCDGGACCQK
jgi:hypothetical protein